MSNAIFVDRLYQKAEDGTVDQSSSIKLGTFFSNVIADDKTYSLQQFYESYLAFIQNADFIYYGETAPQNSRIRIWIDTGSSAETTWRSRND